MSVGHVGKSVEHTGTQTFRSINLVLVTSQSALSSPHSCSCISCRTWALQAECCSFWLMCPLGGLSVQPIPRTHAGCPVMWGLIALVTCFSYRCCVVFGWLKENAWPCHNTWSRNLTHPKFRSSADGESIQSGLLYLIDYRCWWKPSKTWWNFRNASFRAWLHKRKKMISFGK